MQWNESFYDDIDKYIKNDWVQTESIYPRLMNPCYGSTKPTKPTIKKVIFNPPATIIIWSDNTKSVVKCQNGEPFDPEKGFVMAYLKKLLGNKNEFNKEINKWVWGE